MVLRIELMNYGNHILGWMELNMMQREMIIALVGTLNLPLEESKIVFKALIEDLSAVKNASLSS